MALIQLHFYSHVLQLTSTLSVILPQPVTPPENAAASVVRSVRYPTLYLLHGMSDDHTIWQRRTAVERYVEGRNLAVVMPAVQRSFYTDMVIGPKYWQFISEEVPFVARSLLPLSDKREENFVAGLSMGGYGAFKLALTYPERYAAAASLSGALDVVHLTRLEDNAGELKYIFGQVDGLEGSPNDLFYLAEQISKQDKPQPKLYQWRGVEDFLYEDNVRFREHTHTLGLNVDYNEGPGGHEWWCWDQQIERVIDWLL
jgi:S-formylglutathione hydrolase FrmB